MIEKVQSNGFDDQRFCNKNKFKHYTVSLFLFLLIRNKIVLCSCDVILIT